MADGGGGGFSDPCLFVCYYVWVVFGLFFPPGCVCACMRVCVLILGCLGLFCSGRGEGAWPFGFGFFVCLFSDIIHHIPSRWRLPRGWRCPSRLFLSNWRRWWSGWPPWTETRPSCVSGSRALPATACRSVLSPGAGACIAPGDKTTAQPL